MIIEIRVDEVFATPLTEEEKDKADLKARILEARDYLVKTNHKFYIGYIPKDGEDLTIIQKLREEDLLFIRANNVPNS